MLKLQFDWYIIIKFLFVRTPEETRRVQFCVTHIVANIFLRQMGCTLAGNLLFKDILMIIRFYCETNPFSGYRKDYYLSHMKGSNATLF